MKVLGDFLAIILFFIVYRMSGNMLAATAVAIAIGVLQAALLYWKYKKLEMVQWLSLGLVAVFGGITLLIGDSSYIMLKTTALMWLLALIMLIMQWRGKNGIKILLSKELQLPNEVWNRLSYTWIIFFALMGLVNLLVAYPFTPEKEALWVDYKLYVYLPAMLIFSLGQGVYLFQYLKKENQ